MGALLWLVVGYLQLRLARRYVGERGRARLDDLTDERLQGLHAAMTNRPLHHAVGFGVVICALGAGFAVVTGPPLLVAAWVAAAAVLLLARGGRRRTADVLDAELATRSLGPCPSRPHSERRERRQRVAVGVALVGYVVGQVAEFAGERFEQPALTAIGAVALLVAFVALAVLAWTMVWVFGDEDRAARRT